MEKLRRGLIRWNVAPLSLVAFLVWAMTDMTLFYQSSACELPDWHVGAIMGYLIGIAGIIYKMYDSLQKDRGRNESYRDREDDTEPELNEPKINARHKAGNPRHGDRY